MNLDKAIEILQLTDEEIAELTMVKLSRKYAKLKRESGNDEDELLTEAFDYLKVNYISVKSTLEDKYKIEDSLFPSANLTIETEFSIKHSMFLTVDKVPIEPATGAFDENTTVPIIPVKDIAHRDTIYCMWNNQVFKSEAVVKDITEEQYRELMK